MKSLVFYLFLLIFLKVSASHAITETIFDLPAQHSFQSVGQLISSENYAQALESLDAMIPVLEGKDKQLASFAAGVAASKLDKHDLVLTYLRELYQISYLDAYTYYYRGRAYFYKRQFNVAKAYFDKALRIKKIGRGLRDELNFLSGQISLNLRRGSEAYKKLNPLVRRWRGSERRAELLEILLEASLKKRVFSSGRYCRWFKNLYIDHPTNTSSKSWGFRSANLKFKGSKVNCKLKTEHKRSKLKRLYLEGLNSEILVHLEEVQQSKKEHKVLRAAFDYYTGRPDKALSQLKTVKNFEDEYKEKLKLARTAYYAGETDYALSVYKKLYEKEKRSDRKAWLLNEQASLNLELSNFKTAELFYMRLSKGSKRRKYNRRAMWGLPWSQFLAGEHKKAYEGFQKLKHLKQQKSWRYSFVQLDQIDYWSARALQKSGRELEAVEILKTVSADPAVSYYSILSAMRLEEVARKNSFNLSMVDFLNRPWIQKSEIKKARLAKFLKGYEPTSRAIASEPFDQMSPFVAKAVASVVKTVDPLAEYQMYADSFLRSSALKKLGLMEAANDELKFVKRKSKTKNLKRRLLEHFKSFKDFSSLSRLAALSFAKERQSNEGGKSRAYWRQAYPLAYKEEVQASAEEFKVSTALVWGIMRAESFFDPKILSPVGARGLLQIMPYTATKLQNLIQGRSPASIKMSSEEQSEVSASLLEPAVNVRYGAKYLSRLDKQFKGHLPFVAAAYNAGPHRVKLWSTRFKSQSQDEFTERVPFKETKAYIKKVMRNMFVYSSLYGVGADVSFLIKPPPYEHSGVVPFAEYWGEI